MLDHYKILFARPGTVPMTTAGVLARMPLSMVGVGVITMVAQTDGRYALAGTLAATYAFAVAAATPQVARLVDRYGQRRIVLPAALLSAAGLAALVAVSALGGPDVLLFVFAVVAGITPSAPALVRSRWSHLLKDDPKHLHTAYSLEAVLDEVCFIVGPPISIGLSVVLFPQAGPLVGAVFMLVGAAWLVSQRRTEPPLDTETAGRPSGFLSALGDRTVRSVLVVMIALGAIIGTVDVVSVAFAELQGSAALASVVLSVYAIGSCASGLVFGSRTLTRPLGGLLRIGLIATAVLTLPLLVVGSIATLSAAVFVAGIFFAPTMILAAQLIEKNVPGRSLTEALTWSTAGLGLGTAIGPAIAGPLIDARGAGSGFWVAVGAGLALLIITVVARKSLREQTATAIPDPSPANPSARRIARQRLTR